LLLVAP